MHISRLNLNLLLSLEALLTECNVSSAAKRTFITQSAMSHNLSRLREIFHDELLFRTGNTLNRTPRGETLLNDVQDLLEQIQSLIEQQKFDPKQQKRTFIIGMTEYSDFLMVPFYREIEQENYQINILAHHLPLYAQQAMLNNQQIEASIGITYELTSLPHEVLFTEPLVCVMRKDHPLASKGLTKQRYLSANHLCFMVNDLGKGYITDIILSSMGYQRQVVMRLPHIMAALNTVAQTDLIATLPLGIVNDMPIKLNLVTKTLPFKLPHVSFVIAWHPRSSHDKGLMWLIQTLKSMFHDRAQLMQD